LHICLDSQETAKNKIWSCHDLPTSRYGPPKFTASRPTSKLLMALTFLFLKILMWFQHCRAPNVKEKTVSVNFLTPRGPSPSFKYPERQDILNVPYCDILSTVSATTTTGRTYIVEVAEQKNATNALQKKI